MARLLGLRASGVLAFDEGEHAAGELLRLLEMRKMAGALDRLERAPGISGAIGAAVALA